MIGLMLSLQLAAAGCAGVPANHVSAVEAQASRNVQQAIAGARRVRDASPRCGEAHLAFALALNPRLQASEGLTALGLSREYRGALERALEFNPGLLRARTELIEFFFHAPPIAGGDVARARREIVTLARTNRLEAARLSAALEMRHGTEMGALAALERWADLAPQNVDAVVTLARRLIIIDRHRDADRRLARLDSSSSPRLQRQAAAYWRGRLRVDGGFELDQAVVFLTRYVDAGPVTDRPSMLPARPMALFRLGEALEASGRCADAVTRFREAQALDRSIDGMAEALARTARCA